MSFYIVQEYLVVLLVLGVLTATILIFAVSFILFQEGIRQGAYWVKIGDRLGPDLRADEMWARRIERGFLSIL